MRQAINGAEEKVKPERFLARPLRPGSLAAQAEQGVGHDLLGQAGLAFLASPTSTPCTRALPLALPA